MPELSDQQMYIECMALLERAAVVPRHRRFRYLAASLPERTLIALLQGTEASRVREQHPYRSLAELIAENIYSTVHKSWFRTGRSADVSHYAARLGLGLMLEHLRRQNVVKYVPSDPFSTLQLRIALGQVRTM